METTASVFPSLEASIKGQKWKSNIKDVIGPKKFMHENFYVSSLEIKF